MGQARRAFPPVRSGVASGESPPIKKVRTFLGLSNFPWHRMGLQCDRGRVGVPCGCTARPGDGHRSSLTERPKPERLGGERTFGSSSVDRPRSTRGAANGRPVRDVKDRPRSNQASRPNGRNATGGTAEAEPVVACRRSEPSQRPKPFRWLRSPCQGACGTGTYQLPAGRDRRRFPEGKVRRRDPVDATHDDTPEGMTALLGPAVVFLSPPKWGSGGHRGPCAGMEGYDPGVCANTIPRRSMTILAC